MSVSLNTGDLLTPDVDLNLDWSLLDGQSVCVALSGGADSHSLLHRLAAHRHRLADLRAIHINHGLHPDATHWSAHCAALCADFSVEFLTLAVTVAGHDGPEANARHARYAALEADLRDNECLATAHHADDQFETLLFRLFTGTSPAGMSGILPSRKFGRGQLIRPLLNVRKAEIELYCQAHSLLYIDDPMNADDALARGWLRQQIVPQIVSRYPQAVEAAGRLASMSAELRRPAIEWPVSLGVWREMPSHDRTGVLMQILAPLGRYSNATVCELERSLLTLRLDHDFAFSTQTACLKVYDDQLHCVANRTLDPETVWPAGSDLEWNETLLRRSQADWLSECDLVVRSAKPGQKLRFANRPRKRFKHWCQENRIPPWERPKIPLIYAGDQLLGVYGFGPASE
ncbi:MAG: tRNA lysidine(34) synthetase TilS [Gammaproteobacteria bacterium]|nr:tRNA lysidine(34) synthetase TilS [Gammaproteobacteria bacterium]